MQASIAFMVPSERPSGRGKWVSTSSGEHRKKSARSAPPWRWSQGQHPAPPRGTDRKYKATFSPLPLPPASAGGRCALAALAALPARSGGRPQRLAARHSAVWTCRSGWGRLKPHRFPGRREGTMSNGISQVQRGEILCHDAHVVSGLRWCGPRQTRRALGDNGQGQ
jgi:hypothetical protein